MGFVFREIAKSRRESGLMFPVTMLFALCLEFSRWRAFGNEIAEVLEVRETSFGRSRFSFGNARTTKMVKMTIDSW